MALDLVPTGADVPNEVNVIVEIPKDADPVKYEVDKSTGAIFVDRGWVDFAETWFFFWGMAIMYLKYLKIRWKASVGLVLTN